MATWESIICNGMDVVESITFTRSDVRADGIKITATGAHVPADKRPRSGWSQAEIDIIGESLIAKLDAELVRMKNGAA